MGIVGTVKPFQAEKKPGDAAFEKAEANLRESLQDAVEDQRRQRDHLSQRMADGVHRCIRIETIHAHAAMHTTVNGNATFQIVCRLVNWEVGRRAKRWRVQTIRRYHGTAQAEVYHSAAEFIGRRLRIQNRLRQKRQTIESLAVL